MTNLSDVEAVVRALTEFFSAHDSEAAETVLNGVTVNDQLSLAEFRDELLDQPTVANMVKRFRMNPFDMENVFDLEDVLRKAAESYPSFDPAVEVVAGLPGGYTDAAGDVAERLAGEQPGKWSVPVDLLFRGSNEQQSFVRYMRWANHIFYDACSGLSAAELTAKCPVPFDSILSLLNHVYIMQLVWKAHLQGREHGFTSRRPVDDIEFAELRQKQAELDDWFVGYADQLPAGEYSEQVSFEFVGGGAGIMSRSEILQHVVTHATYHRGHICGAFYQLGAESPTTDLPVFLRLCTEAQVVSEAVND